MKNLNYLNKFRIKYLGIKGDEHNGAFKIPQDNIIFAVVASNGLGWEHVSLSLLTNTGTTLERCPKWSEMCKLKELFFKDEEIVMQLHPKKSLHVNIHPYTLHLWRPINQEILIPPEFMV